MRKSEKSSIDLKTTRLTLEICVITLKALILENTSLMPGLNAKRDTQKSNGKLSVAPRRLKKSRNVLDHNGGLARNASILMRCVELQSSVHQTRKVKKCRRLLSKSRETKI